MIGPDPHRRAIFFANLHQWREPRADAVDLFLVFGVCIFNKVELFFIDIVPGIDPHLFNNAGRNLGGIWSEMDIRNQRCRIAPAPQFISDIQQIFRLFLTGRRNAHQFRPGFNTADRLLNRRKRIHRIGRGHGLYPDGMMIPQDKITDPNLQRV